MDLWTGKKTKSKGEWNNEEDYGNASEHEEQK